MGYLILFFWLLVLPFLVGVLYAKKGSRISFGASLLWGQFTLWAVFQYIAVFFILKQGRLQSVTAWYVPAAGLLAFLGAAKLVSLWTKGDKPFQKESYLWIKENKILTALFITLWLIQMAALVLLAVNDGDDAYYMAVANIAESSGNMYTANVYAFGNNPLNYRYALAPFPIWIAFLSKISGVHTLVIGHIILGLFLVSLSYVIYAQIGKELFGDNHRKRMQFLIFVALLVIWGNTSSHTAESFLLLRSRQGKALVAGIVFPAIVYVLLKIGHIMEQQKKVTVRYYVMAAVVLLTGCLGSTLGGTLVMMLWASAVCLLALGYKKWNVLAAAAISTLPSVVFAVLYLMQ